MNQKKFLIDLCRKNKNAIIIGSLGTISYDLTDIEHSNKILIRGAMGAAVGCGIGYALGNPEKQVIVIVGEGAFMMKMGSSNTFLTHRLKNLSVYLINNGSYLSCGEQKNNFNWGPSDSVEEVTNNFYVVDVS